MATVTKTSINWGGLVKGAAIVTAVLVAGVVATSVAPGLLDLGWKAIDGTVVEQFAQGVVELVKGIGNWFATDGVQLGKDGLDVAKSGIQSIAEFLGVNGKQVLQADVDSAKAAIGTIAGLATVGTAAAVAVPALRNIDYKRTTLHHVPDPVGPPPAGPAGFTQRVSPRGQHYANHADAARATQAQKRDYSTPRDGDFAKQFEKPHNGDFASMIDADRQALDKALGK